jgi:3-dehydroquinate synthase
MELDKKVQAGKVRLVLLRQLGDALVTSDYNSKILDAVLDERMA